MNNNEGKTMSESMQSESINELAEALAKAQGEIEGASKDAKNPFFKSKYADLHSVMDCAKLPLMTNGLSVVQPTQMIDGQLSLVTILMHKSGQWIKGIMPLILTKQDPQAVGSAMTYFRRYSYCAMLGISQFDDDGEATMDRKKAPSDEPVPELVHVGSVIYTFDDLTKKILVEKKEVVDQEKLKAFLSFKSKDSGKPLATVINAALRKEESFQGFYGAYQRFASLKKDEEPVPF